MSKCQNCWKFQALAHIIANLSSRRKKCFEILSNGINRSVKKYFFEQTKDSGVILKYVNLIRFDCCWVFSFIFLNGNVLSITRITESSKCPLINPFKPNRISQPYKLDLSISVVGAVKHFKPSSKYFY